VSYRNPNSGFLGINIGGNNSPFLEIYVQEVLPDPSLYKFPKKDIDELPEEYLLIDNSVKESEVLNAPYNSIIGRVVSGDSHNSEVIAYPMMQGHMTLPLKAGEHVWAIYNNGRYYWLCRKSFDQQVDDVNISWGGRYKSSGTLKRVKDSAKANEDPSSDNCILPSNKNPKINTVFPVEATTQDQIDMQTYWSERSKSILEPVPRYKKRPGDLVLQGSNNTLICLGLGGGHKKEDKLPYGSVEAEKHISGILPDVSDGYNRGTIDIVTGRGRYQPDTATNSSSLGDKPERTSCATIMSEFGYKENDKNTTLNDESRKKSPIEGDPDFGFDASRIYISSYCELDNEFTLIPNYPKIPPVVTAAVGSFPETSKGASVVLKSDNLRFIARQHVAADFFTQSSAEDVNGSIRLVKEGTRDKDGHSTIDGLGASMISLESDGTVMIDGATVVIGTGREVSNAKGDQIFLGAGATEPIILGNLMTELLSDFFDQLQNWLSKKYDNHIHPTGTGPSGIPTVIGDDAGTGTAKGKLESTLSKIGKTK
jgi:hypothetical protein